MQRDEIPPGTLYMLILRTLARGGEMHGYEIASFIKRVSDEVLKVEEGSLYPALQRLLKTKLLRAEWTISSLTNRRVRVYQITKAGLHHLEQEISSFDRMLEGIQMVLGPERRTATS